MGPVEANLKILATIASSRDIGSRNVQRRRSRKRRNRAIVENGSNSQDDIALVAGEFIILICGFWTQGRLIILVHKESGSRPIRRLMEAMFLWPIVLFAKWLE